MKHAIALRYWLPLRLLCMLFICYTIVQPVQAQALCQGSLGDPIVNITFGSGNNPGPPLTAVQGLQYYPSDCPNDGFYSLRNSSNGCFSNTWHNISSDHTGNGSGYFMLINASVQPSVFYLDTVRGLCGGTTYEFAAWVMNVQQPSAVRVCNGSIILPNVTFTIERTDGTVLVTNTIGNVPTTLSPVWNQYGVFFTTPANVSDVVLRIKNNAPGGCGNDLALDDITFRPCGPQLTATIAGASADSLNFCEGPAHSFQLNANITGSSGTPAYQWQRRFDGGPWVDIPGATNTTYIGSLPAGTMAGVYDYRLGTATAGNIGTGRCRSVSRPLRLRVNANPLVNITTSGPACAGNFFALNASGGNQFAWLGPNGFTASGSIVAIPDLQLSQGGNYSVTVTSEAGCIASKSITVSVSPAVTVSANFSDTTICRKTSIQLSATGSSNYQWSPATGLSSASIANPLAAPLDSIRYRVVALEATGCSDTAFVNVNVIAPATANAGPDKAVIKGTPATLQGSILGQYAQYYWLPTVGLSNPNSLQPVINTQVDATYWLTVVSPGGCGISVDTVQVKVFKDIFIPTAFSPDGNGVNDRWGITALQAYSNYELLVYNRWGALVFQTKNQYKTWDGYLGGKPLPAGAYVYFLHIADIPKTFQGTVMIVQ